MLPDLINFIDENGLKLMLDLKGWHYCNNAINMFGLAVIKPDFYPNNHILALGKKGYIYSAGETSIEYKNMRFSKTQDLLDFFGTKAIDDFSNWSFIEEKEWVLTDGNNKLITSFTTLDQLPKRTEYRC